MRIYTLRCTNCRHIFDMDMLLSQYILFNEIHTASLECPKCKISMHPTRVIAHPITAIYKDDDFTLRKKEND